jgi:putative restriction endonuclease
VGARLTICVGEKTDLEQAATRHGQGNRPGVPLARNAGERHACDDRTDWIPMPPSWSPNIVSFKTYNTTGAEGLSFWESVRDRLNRQHIGGLAEDGPRYGEPHLFRPRLGQGAFRVLVTDIYQRRCAVTQERTLPALEAAHIRPYGDGGEHEARNGILLRRDIHSLFDAGYVTVTPDLRFEVSRRIREELENGKHYYALHGHQIKSALGYRAEP